MRGGSPGADTLLNFFRDLNYAGPLWVVVGRIPETMLDLFAGELDRGDEAAALYFGLRRYAAELNVPILEDVTDAQGVAVLTTARLVLLMAQMERRGYVSVAWPDSPFVNPQTSRVAITMTPAGEVRHAELQRKAKGGPPA